MEQGRASRTALSIALIRAAHRLDSGPRLFDDPLAARLCGVSDEEVVGAQENWIPEVLHPWILVRFRVAEDAIGAAVGAGVRQLVILGAGLDTFGYRNPYPGLRVFEVDHPDTQEWKRERLRDAGIGVPESVAFVAADFEGDELGYALGAAGFDRAAPAIFVCLGVVMYLSRAATLRLFAFAAGLDAHAELVVDYNDPAATRSAEQRAMGADVLTRVADQGEPWQTFFAPAELARELEGLGFDRIADTSVPETLSRYGFDPDPKYDVFAGRIAHAVRE
ncbi:class I SAM-dependent methyltransferase [Nocardia sp. NPDC055321]